MAWAPRDGPPPSHISTVTLGLVSPTANAERKPELWPPYCFLLFGAGEYFFMTRTPGGLHRTAIAILCSPFGVV